MTTPIRKRPDGSIDTAFYVERGLRFRAQAAHAIWSKATGSGGNI